MKTTLETALANSSLMTPAMKEYLGKVNITAQADWDRWPEANGMRRRLFDLGMALGLSVEQISFDLKHANVDCTGGRW